ncbi:hypothetical protein B0A50_04698 [Salinomyces thailandicus]|uniref:Uncharacterized protein n=1 Tax=Salinomyces thailandicus TaxID=706561 RepID=A0A4U0TW46_9PEZI|nr:hypothetical protein B0A50_04698 [Salinomyces thailandica]
MRKTTAVRNRIIHQTSPRFFTVEGASSRWNNKDLEPVPQNNKMEIPMPSTPTVLGFLFGFAHLPLAPPKPKSLAFLAFLKGYTVFSDSSYTSATNSQQLLN